MLENYSRNMHSRSHAETDAKQLSGLIIKELWHVSSPELNPLDFYIWKHILSHSQISSKTYGQTPGNADLLAVFKHAKIASLHHSNADNFKMLIAKYMLINLLYAYMITK